MLKRELASVAPSEKQIATASTELPLLSSKKSKAWERHQAPPFKAGSTAPPVSPGTRSAAVAGVRLGTSATNVPKTITARPIQIQPTSGFRNALMIG